MFRKRPEPAGPVEWVIVGLGNPGPEYAGTRHNVGFDVVELLADRHRIKLDKSKHRARFGSGKFWDASVLLVKPLTYMNLSGQAVGPILRDAGLKPDRLIVLADDTDLPPGKIRIRAEGSAGGHNGHKSLIATLGTNVYARVKIGIGRVSREGTIDHVLGKFHGDERVVVQESLVRAADAVEAIVSEGIDLAMGRFNG